MEQDGRPEEMELVAEQSADDGGAVARRRDGSACRELRNGFRHAEQRGAKVARDGGDECGERVAKHLRAGARHEWVGDVVSDGQRALYHRAGVQHPAHGHTNAECAVTAVSCSRHGLRRGPPPRYVRLCG